MKKLILIVFFLILFSTAVLSYYSEEWNVYTNEFDYVLGFFDGFFFQVDGSINVTENINLEGNLTSSTGCVRTFFEKNSQNDNKNTFVVEGC